MQSALHMCPLFCAPIALDIAATSQSSSRPGNTYQLTHAPPRAGDFTSLYSPARQCTARRWLPRFYGDVACLFSTTSNIGPLRKNTAARASTTLIRITPFFLAVHTDVIYTSSCTYRYMNVQYVHRNPVHARTARRLVSHVAVFLWYLLQAYTDKHIRALSCLHTQLSLLQVHIHTCVYKNLFFVFDTYMRISIAHHL